MDFQGRPGQIYVVVTLLPLASFVLLLLAAALRSFLRSNRQGGLGESLYQLVGGDRPPKWPAYVATGAIALSCVLSLLGFVIHFTEGPERKIEELEKVIAYQEHTFHHATDAAERARAHDALMVAEQTLKPYQERWNGELTWASIAPAGLADPEQGTSLRLGYHIDTLSATMFLMVTFIATFIHLFSMGYMAEELDPEVADHQVHTAEGHLHRRGRFGRFFMYLSLFCFSMLNLVLADNLFQVFVSWELVGICSYLLVGFYYERRSASNAANKAFITNRVGDAGFILGLLIVWTYLGTFSFDSMFHRLRAPMRDEAGNTLVAGGQIVRGDPQSAGAGSVSRSAIPFVIHGPGTGGSEALLWPRAELKDVEARKLDPGGRVEVADSPGPHALGHMPYWMMVVAGLGIFLGCVGKSAQFPLHVWLPDAMEGPTPVSALIHAATMVAAGVYLVGRCYPLFTPEVLLVIAYTGGITLFVAATVAVVMTDIKKVLAYSTVSQLGYMMLALGVGGWAAGLFHLITHAFFKALLFLGSGSVIYGCHHEQDMSRMGGLLSKMKITAATMGIGVLTIAGIPLFSGWYSKDAIMAQALGFAQVHPDHGLLFVLPLVTAGLTAFYMARMWFLTFAGEPRDAHVYEHAHESPRLMTVPLVVLAACSVIVAWGWPVWDAEQSQLEAHLHHSQPVSVMSDFGYSEGDPQIEGLRVLPAERNIRAQARESHELAGALALLTAGLGIVFAAAIYYYRLLDPAEAMEQAAGLHRFLMHKWYFDELYSVLLVRPAMIVAGWCRAFDAHAIDGLINFLGRFTIRVSSWDGWFDSHVVDGLVNVTGDVIYGAGSRLRGVQTGSLRNYVLFLALGAVATFLILAWFVAAAVAG